MIALIPARKNSKGLKNKNILKIGGIPLIAHTIIAAKKADNIKEVFVSTDCNKIAKIAIQYGAKVPFLRPKKLARDTSDSIDVYRFMIKKLEKIYKKKIINFVCLLPTCPLRSSKDIDKAIDIFLKKKADSVISVTEAHYPIDWNLKIKKNYLLKKFDNKFKNIKNRQKLKPTIIPNGGIYIFKKAMIMKQRDYYSKKTFGYLMPKKRSIDIDDYIDFFLAKSIFDKVV